MNESKKICEICKKEDKDVKEELIPTKFSRYVKMNICNDCNLVIIRSVIEKYR